MSIQDQPPPKHSASQPIWEMVIDDVCKYIDPETVGALVADMRERDQVGRERYGTPLTAHNGRDALIDAYQESLDLCVYLRQAIEEGASGVTRIVYFKSLEMAYDLRSVITERAKQERAGK